MSAEVFFIGVDVGCRSLSAAIPGAVRDFEHSAAGLAQLVEWARTRSSGELRAVCESSGPYSRKLANLLGGLGFQTAIVPPQRVRANALALGRRSKTDRIDAQVILDYAMHVKPLPWTAPPAAQAQLAALWQAVSDLKGERRRWLNRRHAFEQLPDTPSQLLALPERLCAAFEAEQQQLEASLADLLAEPQLAQRHQLLRSIPGIGPQTALVLLARAEILLTRTDKQLTAYAGLAPAHKLSGSSVRGKSRITRQGDNQLRTLLYLAALSASRKPPFAEFYQRLRRNGKPPKVALIAVARKLLLAAGSVMRSGKPFDPGLD